MRKNLKIDVCATACLKKSIAPTGVGIQKL